MRNPRMTVQILDPRFACSQLRSADYIYSHPSGILDLDKDIYIERD